MQALEMLCEENRIAIRMTPAACVSQTPRTINDEVDLACSFEVNLVRAKARYEFRDDPLLGWLEPVVRIGKLFLHCVWKVFLCCNTKKNTTHGEHRCCMCKNQSFKASESRLLDP